MAIVAYSNCNIATMVDNGIPYGMIRDGALVRNGRFLEWVGHRRDLQRSFGSCLVVDLGGALVTPCLIDCHSHIVFGGNRAAEFELRLKGAGYEEIAAAGGGILSTMKATREASEDELLRSSLPRLDAVAGEGVATVEIKSGYGLDIDNEIKMLRVARRLGTERSIDIRTTWLAAHAIPPEYSGRADDYISEVVIKGLGIANDLGLVDAVDAFCEKLAFNPAQTERLFKYAKSLGLPIKVHAEQLSLMGGAALAAGYGAVSADHLEYLDEPGIKAMKRAGTVAVLLPGAFYTLRESKVPPVEALRRMNVPIAVATDGNPGSSPLFSLLTAMNMACTLFRLTPEEALVGTTRSAARALGINEDRGTLEIGKLAKFSVWNISEPGELSYSIGLNSLRTDSECTSC